MGGGNSKEKYVSKELTKYWGGQGPRREPAIRAREGASSLSWGNLRRFDPAKRRKRGVLIDEHEETGRGAVGSEHNWQGHEGQVRIHRLIQKKKGNAYSHRNTLPQESEMRRTGTFKDHHRASMP